MLEALVIAVFLSAQPRSDFGVRVPPSTPAEAWERSSPAGKGARKQVEVSGPFACIVARVTDGDTFRCSDGVRVRLSAIDTPEMPGSCQPGRQCAPGDPRAARAALSKLIAGRTVRCEPTGKSYNRVAAWCSVGGQDLSCAMLKGGYAIKLAKFDREGRLGRCN